MIQRTLPAIALAMLAAGCSGSNSGGGVAAAAAAMQPGKWEMKTEMLEMKVANMPAGVTMPKQAPTTTTTCITPEQAKAGPGDMTKAMAGSGCTIGKNENNGGKISIETTCKTPAGEVNSKTTGSFSATEFTMDSESTTTGAQASTAKMRISAKRIGDCDK